MIDYLALQRHEFCHFNVIRASTKKSTYLCWGTTKTCGISSACRACGPRDFVIIENDKRMSPVCNQNCLVSVSLEERIARNFSVTPKT